MGDDLALRGRTAAEEALRICLADPPQARALATDVLAGGPDDATAAVAEYALGLAAREENSPGAARTHLRRAIELAERSGLTAQAAQARLKLAGVLALEGQTDTALAELSKASPGVQGVDAARLRVQRALIVQRLGRWEDALEEYRVAIPVLRRADAVVDEVQARVNRAIVHGWRGEYAAAEADLLRAEELRLQSDADIPPGIVHSNLAFVAGRRGDVPAALRWWEQAEEEFPPRGVATALLDRAEVLLSVRLVPEAAEAAGRAADIFGAAGMELDLAEARLLLAQAQLLAGDSDAAATAAAGAREAFAAQQRPGWGALASYVEARAAWAAGDGDVLSSSILADLIDELETAGWVAPALDARLMAARLALDEGRLAAARPHLETVSAARRRGPADVRARGWYAEALLRLAAGNRRGGERALRHGLQVLDDHRATLGATELRVHAATRAEDLAELGLRVALEGGRPPVAFRWAELWRAGALRRRPARPPRDAGVAEALAELRHVTSEIELAGSEARSVTRLLRRQRELELAIRDRLRASPGGDDGTAAGGHSLGDVRDALDGRALVEFFAVGGRVHAVTATDCRARLFELCNVADIGPEVTALRFGFTRLVRGHGSPASLETFSSSSDYSTALLDELLLLPLRSEIGDRPLVVVPTGALHGVPWAALPTCRGRPVSVAPSAAMWLGAAAQPFEPGGSVLLAAGPGVAEAEAEVRDLAGIHTGARVLLGADATAAAVARGLDGADLAHVVAHGRFRIDNPSFSSLQFADGQLTVYDLELLERAPRLLVLSACESGVHAVRPGDELIGLAAALFSVGSATLIASVVPVPDAATHPLMVDFHRRLASGAAPAVALAAAQTSVGEGLGLHPASTAGFVCLGA